MKAATAFTALASLLVATVGVATGQEGMQAPVAAPRTQSHARASSGVIGQLLANAAPGDVVVVPAGEYHEHIQIDRSLTLLGEGKVVIDGDSSGDIVEILAPGVTFKGFAIRNTGIDLDKENAGIRVLAERAVIEDNVLEDILFGIDLREAPSSIVRHNRIGGKHLDIARRGDGLRLWRSGDTLVERNTMHDGRDAILWYSNNVVVRENVSEACRYGLHLMFSDSVTIENNVLTANSVGIYLMYSTGIVLAGNQLIRNRGPSGYGIGLKEADKFVVRDNTIVGNRTGIYIDGSPFTKAQPGVFTRNTIAYNDIGFTFLPSAKGNELSENNFIDNIDQVSVAGRGDLSANQFWKGDRGNFWSDYCGYDQNGDGVGDFVHESQTLFDNLMDKHPGLRLFLFSPAQQAIELVGRVLPAVRPEAKFTDEVPLMVPVTTGSVRTASTHSVAPLAIAGGAMLTAGLAVLATDLPRRSRAGRQGGRWRSTTLKGVGQ